jgi:hypothetical protein
MLSHLSGMKFESSNTSMGIIKCELPVSAVAEKKSLLMSARAFCKKVVQESNEQHRRKQQHQLAEQAVKKIKTSQPGTGTMFQTSKRRSMSHELDTAVGAFIFQNGLPFRLVDTPQFEAMLNADFLIRMWTPFLAVLRK